MNANEVKKLDGEKIVNMYGRFDVVIESGKGARCVDKNGKTYIDFTAGIGVNSLGFCDRAWIEAVTRQLSKLQHTSNLYFTEPQVEVAELLTERTGLSKVSFANSGAEANEAAIKTARKYGAEVLGLTNNKIVTLDESFHGRTMATITATGQDHYHKYFTPFLDGFDYCKANDIEMLKKLVDENTCAVMMEIIQGEGGVKDVDEEFIKAAEALCREKNILLIIDEVQTGIGRTGKLFSYEYFGIKPDIVTFAKGIGAGLPIGGAIYSEKCCDILEPGDHGTTFGGNPVVCAGAFEVLSRMDAHFLNEVCKKSEYIRERLLEMPKVKSISGKGLMVGIELEESAGLAAGDVVKAALDEGLLLLTAKDKVRLLPPLTITMDEIEGGLYILEKVLG